MKKLVLVFGLATLSAFAADLTGYIVDKNCASKKAMLGNEECAKSCMSKGAPAVLATDEGKIYAISNQAKVKELAGKKVTVTGKVEGDSITVDSVKTN
jgi:hypothetical protein